MKKQFFRKASEVLRNQMLKDFYGMISGRGINFGLGAALETVI
jgi:hypothetical protein